MTSVVCPGIHKEKRKQVLVNQNNQCAKKPYSRISGLEGYKCPLWQRKTKQGKLDLTNYKIIKLDSDSGNEIENLVALCMNCYKVLVKRTENNSDESESESESSEDDTPTRKQLAKSKPAKSKPTITVNKNYYVDTLIFKSECVSTRPSHNSTSAESNTIKEYSIDEIKRLYEAFYRFVYVTEKWRVTYYPERPGTVEAKELPLMVSTTKLIGNYGDVYDVTYLLKNHSDDQNIWICINCEGKNRFIRINQHDTNVVEPLNVTNADTNTKNTQPNTESMSNNGTKECVICLENITTKIALVPCGHTQFHSECIEKIPATNKLCPICKQQVRSMIRIYD